MVYASGFLPSEKSLALALFLLAAPLGSAQAAINFSFYGEDAGGAGSATMSFDLSGGTPVGNTVQISLQNTSSTTLLNGKGVNSPGITGFGFDFIPDLNLVDLASWSLKAWDNNSNFVTIGASSCTNCDWVMGTTQAGVTFDFLPQITSGVSGALYNPDATEGLPGGANNTYFTEALLLLDFKNSIQVTDVTAAYVRMQNVGRNGAGSLKLTGERGGNGGDVPEPMSILLVALGVFGSLRLGRRA